jgi:transposase
MLADELDYVVGVDTHRDEHVLAVVAAATGAVVAGCEVAATARGYRQALGFAEQRAAGPTGSTRCGRRARRLPARR